jgi:hypothetical protein
MWAGTRDLRDAAGAPEFAALAPDVHAVFAFADDACLVIRVRQQPRHFAGA